MDSGLRRLVLNMLRLGDSNAENPILVVATVSCGTTDCMSAMINHHR